MWTSYKTKNTLYINEMYSFFNEDCEKGYDFQGESHNFWECLYVKEGTVCVSADERVYNLEKGDIIFHKPLEFHKFYVDKDDGAKITVFSFSLGGELSNYFCNKVFTLSDSQRKIFTDLLGYMQAKTDETDIPPEIHGTIRFLYPFKHSKTYSQTVVCYIYQLFLSLADNGTIAEISDSPDAALFKKAVDYMSSNICNQVSIAEIAKLCSISSAGIKRIFNKFAGIGVHKYFLQLKIKAAAELLQGGASVSETAEKLGFSSQGYFSAAFKRETGKSPSEIR